MNNKLSVAVLSLFAGLFSSNVLAYNNLVDANSLPAFHLEPNLNLWGYSGRQTVGEAQGLLPVVGDAGQVWYLAAEGKIGKNDKNGWMLGLGSGYRRVINNQILGGYILFDYSSSATHDKFWIANPGIESLGKVWDFRINGYIPISDDRWTVNHYSSRIDWEDNLGIYDDVRFKEHTEFDHKVIVTQHQFFKEEASSGIGVDAEIGRIVPFIKGLKLFVGGYHFNTNDFGEINGASGRITYRINNYFELEAIDTYDGYKHNTAQVGIRLTLNRYNDKQHNQFGISARLLDPIEHNIATSANGYAVPIKHQSKSETSITRLPKEEIEHDNLWFFKQEAAGRSSEDVQGSGTYEDPFIGFTEDNYKAIDPNIGTIDKFPWLYFAKGNYSFADFPIGAANYRGTANYRFALPYGWGMYGRVDDYKKPADGEDRATFVGGIDLFGGENTLSSIRLFNNEGMQETGINIGSSSLKQSGGVIIQNIHLDNIQVGKNNQNNNDEYKTAMDINNAQNVNLTGSQVYAYNKGPYEPDDGDASAAAYGIKIENGNLNADKDNVISALAVGGRIVTDAIAEVYAQATAQGIAADNSTLIVGSNNSISATTQGGGARTGKPGTNLVADAHANASGISANGSSVNVGNSNFISGEAHGGDDVNAFALLDATANASATASGISANRSSVNIGNSNFISDEAHGGDKAVALVNVYAAADASATASSISAENNSSVTIGNSNSISGEAHGGNNVYAFAVSNATADASATASGVSAKSGSTITIGNANNISSSATGGTVKASGTIATEKASANAYGIFADGSTINIEGGGNIFNVTAQGGEVITVNAKTLSLNGEAFGIDANSSKVIFNFDKIGTENVFNVGGSTNTWGIRADNSSSLQKIEGGTTSNIGTLGELLPYNTFNLILEPWVNEGIGNRIEWTGVGSISWW